MPSSPAAPWSGPNGPRGRCNRAGGPQPPPGAPCAAGHGARPHTASSARRGRGHRSGRRRRPGGDRLGTRRQRAPSRWGGGPLSCSAGSVARVLRATTLGGTTSFGGTTRHQLVGLGRGQAATLLLRTELDLGRLLDRCEEALDRAAGAADLVHLLRHRGTGVGELAVAVLVDRAQGLVDLDELTAREPADDTGLDAVLEDLAVVALQAQADPVADHVGDRRQRRPCRCARPRSSR